MTIEELTEMIRSEAIDYWAAVADMSDWRQKWTWDNLSTMELSGLLECLGYDTLEEYLGNDPELKREFTHDFMEEQKQIAVNIN